MLTNMKRLYEGQNMQTQYTEWGCINDLHFHDLKLAIENDENGHSKRNTGYKIKRK